MRDRGAWRHRRDLASALAEEWKPSEDQPSVAEVLDVELGLFLLEAVAAGEPPEAVWTLLGGYPIGQAAGYAIDSAQQMIRVARELLPAHRAPRDWARLISRYQLVPEHVRGYLIAADRSGFTRRAPRVAPYRFEAYEQALAVLPAYRRERVKIAPPGDYVVRSDRGETGVRIPQWLPLAEPCASHDLASPPARRPFTVTWKQLMDTAQWGDRQEERLGLAQLGLPRLSRWTERLADARPMLRAAEGHLVPTAGLQIKGTFNLLGMVSSGKSTVMDLLSMHAARHGQRVTLIVGDVTTLLRKVDYFNALFADSLGPVAAPVVGQSNRRRHVERLHRLVATGDSRLTALTSPLFDLVSTVCPLDGLRDHASRPWDLSRAPCTRLYPANAEPPAQPYICPHWYACERHAPSRGLVDTPIWVATIPSLVYSQVPKPINPERLRYMEVAWRRSDLLIVDEADQAQAQLDTIFSPGQTLRSGDSEAWLDEIVDHTNAAHRRTGWQLMSDLRVRVWTSAANNAKTAADLMYSLLQIDRFRKPKALLGWIDEDYFTDWTLSQQLAQSWAGFGRPRGPTPAPGWEDDPLYQRLRRAFDAFIDDPFGTPEDQIAASLARLAADVLREVDEVERLSRVKDWLVELTATELTEPGRLQGRRIVVDNLDRQAARLEFTLSVAVLSDQLQLLLSTWRAVEEPIGLEASNPLVFHRPPRDLLTVIPQAPMGQVLGFQYRRDDEDHDRAPMGELRFFRCEGVGRWALTHLAGLFGDAETPPANVLLMSGTSWAGTSARYHVDVPVAAVLEPKQEDVAAVAKSRCELLPIYDESAAHRVITVSGRYGEDRARALAALVRGLVRPRQDGKSLLERHRDRLEPGRRRVLLLTGSYQEARSVALTLARARPGWDGQIRYLIPDDEEFADTWDGPLPLRRGDVAEFSDTGAWILVAPLLAIERGHNILNEDNTAALGAVYFLVRPHPRPDDLTYVAQRINQWAATQIGSLLPAVPPEKRETLLTCGAAFRTAGHRRWRHLLHQKLAYSTLSPVEREALIWSQLVTIWQVIGRLVRGGKPAWVFFCDAAFAPITVNQNEEGHDTIETSLAVGLRSVLERYFREDAIDPDRFLVQALYGPLYQANCTDNLFLLRSLPGLARAIEVADRWFTVAAAAALVVLCARRLLRDSGPARRALLPVALPAILLAATVIAHAVALQRRPLEHPSDPTFRTIFTLGCAAVILLAVGLLWAAVRTRVQRRAVARIATSLGQAPPPGSLQAALAQAVGDPELQIVYWLPDARRHVDASGRPVAEPVAGPGRVVTALVRDGRQIAVVSHTAALPDLERELGAAVRLALENERLQAQALAQLYRLRASRVRIVESGDSERRRLERDLHDGAQQRLLALSYDLRLARAQAQADGDSQSGSLLTQATDQAQAALGELRELAHGIYPAILTEAGLTAALATLADGAPLPVELRGAAQGRSPAAVETAAYLLVVEALDDAAGRGATHAVVSTVRDGGRLVVTVEDDGTDRTSAMVQLDDRVGALDGRLTVEPTRLRAELPCG